MISKTFNRYIWLVNEFLQKKRLTFEEISHDWEICGLGDGKPMPLRTFHQHRKAVQELFGINIICNVQDKYRYYIEDASVLRNDHTRHWLLNSFSISNMISAGHNMNERIIFENIPYGTEYLQTVIEAMQEGKELVLDYQAYGKSRATYHFQPYAMKVYNRRWYILGVITEIGDLRHLGLDRILELEKTDMSYELPNGFSAEKYYTNSVGIYVDKELPVHKVRIRVYGNQVDYLRSLPLHKSQEEVITKYNDYSEFQYRVCLTPELTTQLLAMGDKVTVLEPQELREQIKEKLLECLNKYK